MSGVELGAAWQVVPQLFLRASYLFTEPTVERAAETAIIGKLLAQTPRHVVTTALDWNPLKPIRVTLSSRYNAGQFEDDQNRLALAPYFTLDAALFYELSERVSAGAKVENLLDREVETGRTPDGLVSTGLPRQVSFQLQVRL